jgi:hypothetical protein
MTFEGALIQEQGVTFAVAIVREHVMRSPSDRESALAQFTALFRVPTVLMAQDHRGVAEYWGRRDIVDFMARVPLSRIPWQRYTVS